MRESCSCGAGIHTISYKRALIWRMTHRHDSTEMHELSTETEIAHQIGFTIPDDVKEN